MPLPEPIEQSRNAIVGTLTGDERKGGSVFLAPSAGGSIATIMRVLDNPSLISDLVANLSANTLAIKVFGAQETVNTGSTFFTKIKPEDLNADGLKERAEGMEYSMVRITPPDLEPLKGTDIGGKFKLTDEARDEGILEVVSNGISIVSNSIIDFLDKMTVKALDEAALHGGEIAEGNNWSNIILNGSTPTPPNETAMADIVMAKATLSTNGLRAVGDILVLNPLDEAALMISYGDQYAALLTSLEITVATSPQVEKGTAYVVASGLLGGVTSKNGIVTETWRESAIRSTWVQTYLEPSIYITRPSNVVKIVLSAA